jgi:thymidylate kinase
MDYPIIVVEGPDAVGKTTWSREFKKRYGGRYLHLTLRDRLFAYQVGSIRLALRWSKHCPVIIDRHWPSEQIYGSAYRGGSTLLAQTAFLNRAMRDMGIIYLVALLDTPEETIQAHQDAFVAREEMYAPSEAYARVVYGYFNWAYGSEWNIHVNNFCEHWLPQSQSPVMAHYNYRRHGKDEKTLAEHIDAVYGLAWSQRKLKSMENSMALIESEFLQAATPHLGLRMFTPEITNPDAPLPEVQP